MLTRLRLAAALALLAILAACQDPLTQQPTRANFTAAVADYLAQRGHLCIARYDWPIVVTDAQIADLVCFLGTLSDGYQPPGTAPTSGACVN